MSAGTGMIEHPLEGVVEKIHAELLGHANGLEQRTLAEIEAVLAADDADIIWEHRDHFGRMERYGWFGQCAADYRLRQVSTKADVQQEAHVRGLAWRSIYRNAAVWEKLVEPRGSDKFVTDVLPVLPEKSYCTFALETAEYVAPSATLDLFIEKKQDDPTFSTGDAGRHVRVVRDTARHEAARGPAQELATLGRFPVLYADPPWRYEFAETDNRAIENQYPTLDVDAICALDVRACSQDDAVLFLWATSPKLLEALRVMVAWGFDYRTGMVWVKDRIGMGYYCRERHELLLIGRRGNLPVPFPEHRPDSVIEAPRLEHSAKPELVYATIERMYPGLPKLELFARVARGGDWRVWGNDVRLAAQA